ncbi:spore germination protein [Candidatus Formimonas warabiya]|uniref:Spore germination protein n=1 Tax=Formimonas warabiya TaxID=1761012 RepID=A0A3G1KLV5_FORW1|nr:spore germination protein [Candidatus Formimonas warabiya]ATW23399.1 spore germination protein [Candidatus Formimonas warabiya]
MVFKGLKEKVKRFLHHEKPEKSSEEDNKVLYGALDKNEDYFRDLFRRCSDVVFRSFQIYTPDRIRVLVLFIDGLTNQQVVSENVVRALMIHYLGEKGKSSDPPVLHAQNHVISMTEVTREKRMVKLVNAVLSGNTILIVDGQSEALIISAKGWESRSVGEPQAEPLVRGPRDGFTENLRTNTALIRRRIKSSRLKAEAFEVGSLTKTAIAVLYIEGIANDKVVEEARRRIQRIKTDSILESGYLEQFIEDSPWSFFPQVDVTERPDKISGNLLEGRVAILVDNTPFALIVPVLFLQFLQTPEDYYVRPYQASFLRLLRFVTLNIALLLPSFYIAITTFHQEMLPTPLLISIAQARAGVPFPAFVEALLMELSFEIVREAGLRLPRPMGQAVSIVGGLVIGQSAVTAGLVSQAMLIVVALTAMASFSLPTVHATDALRLLRFPIMVLAATLGLFGVMAALLVILIHLCSLRSFGIPYLSPIAPVSFRDLKDVPIRVPWWAMFTRPRLIGYKEPQRQDFWQMPHPPKKRE